MFNDALYPALWTSQDASVTGGFFQADRQQGEGGIPGSGQQGLQSSRGYQRYIAVQYQYLVAVRQHGHCLRDGMAGTQLLSLLDPLQALIRQGFGDPCAAVAEHHDYLCRIQGSG